MIRHFGTIVAAGGLLIATTAIAQRAGYTDYSANLAAASPTLSHEARQAMNDRIEAVNARFRAAHGGTGPEQFGLQCCQITQISSPAFTLQVNGDNWQVFPYSYLSRTLFTSPDTVWAPVSLPTGVTIVYLDLYYVDALSSLNIVASLIAESGGTPYSGAPQTAVLATAVSSGGSDDFFGIATENLSYAVNNNVEFDSAAGQLRIEVTAAVTTGGLLGFRGADLWWMRQISPAPATATFTDVPITDPFFQYVEALAAAGITAGYPDGRYGVNDPITRGQMAVFLAKALGLYWPF